MTETLDYESTDAAENREAPHPEQFTAAKQVDRAAATEAAARMLAELGMPCQDESTARTPERLVKALDELMYGRFEDPSRHLGVTFPGPAKPGVIAVARVPFVSLCEHHLLPFVGHATIGYLPRPGARVVGLSKLARLLQEYAARPQVQEHLGDQIVNALEQCLDVQGAACIIRAKHSCLGLRGARAFAAEMTTSHLTGVFREHQSWRDELLSITSGSLLD